LRAYSVEPAAPSRADSGRSDPAWLTGACFLAAILALAWHDRNAALAVYALGFWHYLVYFLAYRYGAIAHAAFKRDAVAMKTVALGALGAAYLSAPLDALSLAVVATGFGLNAAAAAVLGGDRTYYGYEVGGLPPRQVKAFPYSFVAHPMLLGNMAAYAGTLLNPVFREQWWPLACGHVALNLGLLLMETRLTPLRLGTPGGASVRRGRVCAGRMAVGALGGGAAGALVALGTAAAGVPAGAGAGACIGAFAAATICRYVPSRRNLGETEHE
jgi:protein-S-isoprenylcysteine O-methyltransferase Ste14